MAVPTNAATTPMASAQPNMATVGWLNTGSPGMASENVPRPVRLSRPMKIRVPMPAARSPGTSTRPSRGPPRPAASISRKAPTNGEPSRVLIAAKLPAAAMTVAAMGGASRAARLTASPITVNVRR